MLLRSFPGCLITALESITYSFELGFSPKEWLSVVAPDCCAGETPIFSERLCFGVHKLGSLVANTLFLLTLLPFKGWARAHLTSAFSSEEPCSWHYLWQTLFTDWAELGSVLAFCPRASHSSSSPASRMLGLSISLPCGLPVPPAFSWGTDCPSQRQQSCLQCDEPSVLPWGVRMLWGIFHSALYSGRCSLVLF